MPYWTDPTTGIQYPYATQAFGNMPSNNVQVIPTNPNGFSLPTPPPNPFGNLPGWNTPASGCYPSGGGTSGTGGGQGGWGNIPTSGGLNPQPVCWFCSTGLPPGGGQIPGPLLGGGNTGGGGTGGGGQGTGPILGGGSTGGGGTGGGGQGTGPILGTGGGGLTPKLVPIPVLPPPPTTITTGGFQGTGGGTLVQVPFLPPTQPKQPTGQLVPAPFLPPKQTYPIPGPPSGVQGGSGKQPSPFVPLGNEGGPLSITAGGIGPTVPLGNVNFPAFSYNPSSGFAFPTLPIISKFGSKSYAPGFGGAAGAGAGTGTGVTAPYGGYGVSIGPEGSGLAGGVAGGIGAF